MANNMKREIIKRHNILNRRVAEEKSEDEILNDVFAVFDKLKDDAIFKDVVSALNEEVEAAKSNYDVKKLYEYNLQETIEEEILDTLAEYGDEIIAKVCEEDGVEVKDTYYSKLYDHAFKRYTTK